MDIIVNGEIDKIPDASIKINRQANYQQHILECLGYGPEHLPMANLLKLYHQLPGRWIIASPVHWEATHNDALITAAGSDLHLSDEESHLWFAEIVNFLKDDGFTPVYYNANTWLFKIDNKPVINSQPLSALLHKSLMPALSALDKSYYWQRLITELQMFLSAHSLNLNRQNLPINGIWFWGEGDFEIPPAKKTIISDDPVLLLINTTRINPLNLTIPWDGDELIIVNDPMQVESSGFREKIKKTKVNWYWNNCSYSVQPKSWWSKLWG
ncbi:MAG: hypothetical protein H0U57_05700 [Tatlockia sp.]|nr:hypothetical protein [Tatlockia sp.]